MNEILKNLARLKEDHFGEPEGIDALYLDAVHFRSFIHALDATEKKSFEVSYLRKSLVVGATYAIVLKIMKLYDREKDGWEINTLRKLWKQIADTDKEADFIISQFDSRNKNSIFEPLLVFRNKCLAHNEEKKRLTWEQIDNALLFCTRVWHLVGKHSNSIMMFPFHDFERVSGEFKCLFSDDQICEAKKAWEKYMEKINAAMNEPVGCTIP